MTTQALGRFGVWNVGHGRGELPDERAVLAVAPPLAAQLRADIHLADSKFLRRSFHGVELHCLAAINGNEANAD